jgi:UDP-N-acetyl-2-amino-2-deoxyglucuronate dehydrogenase
MATTVVDAERMVNEALKANKRLFVVKQNRFNPPVIAVKKAIDEGRFGNIFSVQLNCFWNRHPKYYTASAWKGTMHLDGGTLFTQFSHFIDLLYYFFGDISEAKGYSGNFNHHNIIDFEDTGMVAVRFHSGIIGTINYTVNSYSRNMEGSISIFGEHGTVKIGGQYLNELEYQQFKDHKISNLPPGNPPNNYGEYIGSMSNHDKVYENIIDVLHNEGSIATNGFEGLKNVEIIDKIYKAVK